MSKNKILKKRNLFDIQKELLDKGELINCKATVRKLNHDCQCDKDAVLCGFCIRHYKLRMKYGHMQHVKRTSSLDYLRNI